MNHRDYTEAHLALLGWRPTSEGRGGACRDGVAIYSYAAGSGLCIDEARRPVHPLKLLDTWFMSDELFWPLVHYIRGHHEP
jgi:hypothetical protein